MKTYIPANVVATTKTFVSVALFMLLGLLSTETFAITCNDPGYPYFVTIYSMSQGGNVIMCATESQDSVDQGHGFAFHAFSRVINPAKGIICHDVYGLPGTKCPKSYVFTPAGMVDSSGKPVTCPASVCNN